MLHVTLLLLAAHARAAVLQRRALLHSSMVAIVSAAAPALAYDGFLDYTGGSAGSAGSVRLDGMNGMAKPKTLFSDFTATESGLQLKDYKLGTGPPASAGDRVVLEWGGVTVGYQVVTCSAARRRAAQQRLHAAHQTSDTFLVAGAGSLPTRPLARVCLSHPSSPASQGRYFQARNKPKGGAFEGDGFLDTPLTFTIGDGSVIRGVDEAVRGMSAGGVRRIIVPEELGYPADGFKTVGPFPSTFSGQRALDFVLSSKSSMVDKTLMFDLKLVAIKPGGRGT